MSLPKDILASRLRNELTQCSKYLKTTLDTSDEKLEQYPIEFDIELHNTPGPVRENGRIVNRYYHKFRIIVSSNYPFEKPAVIWKTPIFHPNIMAPEDGGHVCTKLLSEWSFNSTILIFVKGIESLLIAPNGESPFGTSTCTEAAAFFNNGTRTLPIVTTTLPKVVRK
jgi:ubiquitin-protein ligase